MLKPVYTEFQRQRCNNAMMTLTIQLSLRTMPSLQNGVEPQFWSDSIVFNKNVF